MIIENIFPSETKLYALAYEGDCEVGEIGPNGTPWRYVNESELTTSQKKAIERFHKIHENQS